MNARTKELLKNFRPEAAATGAEAPRLAVENCPSSRPSGRQNWWLPSPARDSAPCPACSSDPHCRWKAWGDASGFTPGMEKTLQHRVPRDSAPQLTPVLLSSAGSRQPDQQTRRRRHRSKVSVICWKKVSDAWLGSSKRAVDACHPAPADPACADRGSLGCICAAALEQGHHTASATLPAAPWPSLNAAAAAVGCSTACDTMAAAQSETLQSAGGAVHGFQFKTASTVVTCVTWLFAGPHDPDSAFAAHMEPALSVVSAVLMAT